MPEFPKKEADILAMATQMVAGYKAHHTDFPSINWGLLNFKYMMYRIAKKFQNQVRSQVRIASAAKDSSLDTLKELMKNCLKISEVDTAASPEKLALIGWGPKAAAQMIEAPLPPRNLIAKLQEKGTITLLWDSPSGGGAVRNYIIQRRQATGSSEFGSWQIAGSSLNTHINLTSQSRGVQLEYHVKAANAAGISSPGNSIEVVL